MRRRLRHFIIVGVGLGISPFAFASSIYVAKKKDVLSEIARKTIKGPVWGKHGSLNTLIALNPKIENPNLIFPKQEILIPDEVIGQALATQSQRSIAGACRGNCDCTSPSFSTEYSDFAAERNFKSFDARVLPLLRTHQHFGDR
jgi:hypothetical protein